LFQWTEPKQAPNNNEILQLLQGNYTMRVDMNRKIVEHVVLQQEDLEQQHLEQEHMELQHDTPTKKTKAD